MLKTSDGFTIVEVIVALTIFSVGVLGMGASGAAMIRSSIDLETRELAVQAIDDRLTTVFTDPRYSVLDSIYSGSENLVLGRFTRTTSLSRTTQTVTGGGVLEYLTVDVVVTGGGLAEPMSRSLVVAEP